VKTKKRKDGKKKGFKKKKVSLSVNQVDARRVDSSALSF
jgi:hypothetical protein